MKRSCWVAVGWNSSCCDLRKVETGFSSSPPSVVHQHGWKRKCVELTQRCGVVTDFVSRRDVWLPLFHLRKVNKFLFIMVIFRIYQRKHQEVTHYGLEYIEIHYIEMQFGVSQVLSTQSVLSSHVDGRSIKRTQYPPRRSLQVTVGHRRS